MSAAQPFEVWRGVVAFVMITGLLWLVKRRSPFASADANTLGWPLLIACWVVLIAFLLLLLTT